MKRDPETARVARLEAEVARLRRQTKADARVIAQLARRLDTRLPWRIRLNPRYRAARR